MNKLFAAVSLLAAAGAASASAADLPVRAPETAPAIYSWTGFYTGLNAGGSWARDDATYSGFNANATFTASANSTSMSFIGGGQAGYNWQTGSLVFGIEGDAAWRHQTNTANLVPDPVRPGDQVNTFATQNWLATVRPRVGAAFGNALIYATGGWAVGEVDHGYQQIRVSTGQSHSGSDATTQSGWTIGGGIQWAFWNNWSIGLEYLHVDLGTDTLFLPGATVAGLKFPSSQTIFHDRSDIVRAKLDYKFDWSSPVVAKY
jgi:outer membrane immunogenic protein